MGKKEIIFEEITGRKLDGIAGGMYAYWQSGMTDEEWMNSSYYKEFCEKYKERLKDPSVSLPLGSVMPK